MLDRGDWTGVTHRSGGLTGSDAWADACTSIIGQTVGMTLAMLLEVQAHDTAMDQLHHKLRTLPEREALDQLATARAALETERSEVEERRNEVGRRQKRFEDDVALIEERANSESARLYSGEVTAHKDLQLIQQEIETLNRRREALEDQVIEAMEAGEPIDAELSEIDEKLAANQRNVDLANQTIESVSTEIGAAVAVEEAARQQAAGEIDPELIEAYEKAREQCGGVGASRLEGTTCAGCRLQLPAVEVDRIRKQPNDAMVYCECGRLLVRT